jgi:hypothetical protein
MSDKPESYKPFEFPAGWKRYTRAGLTVLIHKIDNHYKSQFKAVESFSEMLNKEILEFNATKSKAGDVALLENLIAENNHLKSELDLARRQRITADYKVKELHEAMSGHKTIKRLQACERLLVTQMLEKFNDELYYEGEAF